MSVQKKSLMSKRSAEKKVTRKPVQATETIGDSKTLSASALRHGAFAVTSKKARSAGGGHQF